MAMITWNWIREKICPDDVLDAASTIPVSSNRITMYLTMQWVSARRYLDWARAALDRKGEDSWDIALSLAKRAVCRQMDGILAHNHFGCFHGSNYKKKCEFLADLSVPGLALLRDMVIDPRNDIEHTYQLATEDQARRACDLAELFLGATGKEAEIPAIMGLGWNIRISESICTAPGKEHHKIELELTNQHSPMLLIVGYPEFPEVIVILPREAVLRTCPLKEFKSQQVILLNTRLRECLKSENYISRSLSDTFVKALRDQLKL